MKVKNEFIQNLRQEYKTASLSETDVSNDPIAQFDIWFHNAVDANIYEPNVMTLATATPQGKPSARIVLLKGYDKNGFSFYTNYLSKKGKELKKNPYASLVFFWPELERQVRIDGKVEKLDKETSEAYFHTRPKGSQIGAIVSPQSQIISDRNSLEKKVLELSDEYGDKEIPKPAHWGGYSVKPTLIEFWQGRPSRLHDRIVYELKNNLWIKNRLAP